MSQGNSNSLVNLGDLSKPANTLIKKIAKGVGGFFKPFQIKRVAKAEAAAAMIKTQSDIQITDLHHRAVHRWIEEEAQRQLNMETITIQALPHLNEEANPNSMDDDWIVNFFDKSRKVSDSEMQALWARVLAGEANAPGTYSKRTVNFLLEMEKTDAELFSKLCRFGWTISGHIVPLIFDVDDEIYNRHGINYPTLSHLDSIGIIRLNSLTGFILNRLPKSVVADYYGKQIYLDMPKDTDNVLKIGYMLPTSVGQELTSICESEPVDGFLDYVKDNWKQYLPEIENNKKNKIEEGYAILDEMVGVAKSDQTDGSINHDEVIYGERSKS
ncbi:MAG: DUF2806 domain-containing protein [Gemmatimonadota bacterium]|nr:DUF2806 domain-containing protein [Gemmatimonadota bacterium]MDE2953093.1 DUF2806 domain-containing protein [Gemmatimonadota bacterium]